MEMQAGDMEMHIVHAYRWEDGRRRGRRGCVGCAPSQKQKQVEICAGGLLLLLLLLLLAARRGARCNKWPCNMQMAVINDCRNHRGNDKNDFIFYKPPYKL